MSCDSWDPQPHWQPGQSLATLAEKLVAVGTPPRRVACGAFAAEVGWAEIRLFFAGIPENMGDKKLRILTGMTALVCLSMTTCVCAQREMTEVALEPATLGSTGNVHVFGETILCGQPSEEDLEIAKSQGFKTIISLRMPEETKWDEGPVVEALGMKFVRIPFAGAEALTDDVFDKIRRILSDNQAGPVMLHCASANRVGAIWLAHRVVDHELSVEQAEKEAAIVGLSSEGYRKRALRYAEKHGTVSLPNKAMP